VVAQVADHSRGERRQPGDLVGPQQVQGATEHLQRVPAGRRTGGDRPPPRGLPRFVDGQGRRGTTSDEGPPGPGPAVLGRLQQECPGPVVGQLPVGRQRGLRVREDGPHDRDHPVAGGEVAELLECRGGGTHPRIRPPSPDGSSWLVWMTGTTDQSSPRSVSVSKQLKVPLWHAAPVWSTRSRTVSPSQSISTARTCCTCPEVSPLTQRCPREREKYTPRRVASVSASAASSIHAIMST